MCMQMRCDLRLASLLQRHETPGSQSRGSHDARIHTQTELHLIPKQLFLSYVTSSHLQVRHGGDKWEWSLSPEKVRWWKRADVWLRCVHCVCICGWESVHACLFVCTFNCDCVSVSLSSKLTCFSLYSDFSDRAAFSQTCVRCGLCVCMYSTSHFANHIHVTVSA